MDRKSRDRNFLIYGVGDNDVYNNSDGSKWRKIECKFYQRWVNMIERCYSKPLHERLPYYANCEVIDEWKKFSNFKKWMESQDWDGKELDKDIINPGNKIYSPKTCCFVSRKLNNLFRNSDSIRGKYPQGVTLQTQTNRYMSRIRIDGNVKNLGVHSTIHNAEEAYIKAKINLILSLAEMEEDITVKEGLMKHYKLWVAKLQVDKDT